MGLNQFCDLSQEEFETQYLMTTPPPEDDLSQVEPEDLKRLDYPSAFDWNAKGAVQKPKNQGQCGSCWAHAAAAATES